MIIALKERLYRVVGIRVDGSRFVVNSDLTGYEALRAREALTQSNAFDGATVELDQPRTEPADCGSVAS